MAVAVVSLAVIQWAVRQRDIKAYEKQSQNRRNGEEKRISNGFEDYGNQEIRV